MSWERAGRFAWIAPLLTVASEVAYFVIAAYPDDEAEGVEVLFSLTFLTYAVVGSLIASRHPRNPVGWLFCVSGFCFSASETLYAYARDPSEPPGFVAAAWLHSWAGDPAAVVVVLLVLLFPTGHFLSHRWRLAGIGVIAASVVWALALAFDPGPLRPVDTISNPLGIDGAGAILDPIASLGPIVLVGGILLAIGGVIVRFRRARARERQQLKWLALAAGFMVTVLLASLALLLLVDTDEGAWDFVTALLVCAGIAALPVAAAIAILRERLYEIDVVINRALVYVALTATLGGAYLGLVLLLQLVLAPVTAESGLAIAGSTLAVAALFRPARARIQAEVDRRFYRHRYDAARTLADFAVRVRDQVELDALSGDLRQAVRETVQPAHVSLWLRIPR
jgi:uncharacterized membrane protein HdeD (DUF308 family)